MLRGNRLYILAAIGLALIIFVSGVTVYNLDNPITESASTKEHSSPTKDVLPPPINRIANSLESLNEEQRSKENATHERRDLDAQEGAWRWTKWSAWAAIIQLLLTIFGFFFIVQSLRQSVNAERPHVRFYRTIKQRDKRGRIEAVNGINFRNYGRTPALVRSLSLRFALAGTPPTPQDAGTPRIWPDDSVMPQDEEWPRKHWIPPFDGPSIDALVAQHGKDGVRLFVFGEICYRDAFGQERRSGFCREWDGSNFTYNTTDIGGDERLNYST